MAEKKRMEALSVEEDRAHSMHRLVLRKGLGQDLEAASP
jgi:hypothetical protein